MRGLRVVFFALVVTILAGAQSKLSLTPDQIYANNKDSVVTIITFDGNEKAVGQGSGFIVGQDRVATNHHVVEGSSSALIAFSDGNVAKTTVAVSDSPVKDIVILKVATGNRPKITIGNELQLQVGEPIYVIGAPKGLTASFSLGIVSAFRQEEGEFLIQMTASIAPGSSGGPVLDRRGQVVGIATAKMKEGSFGFAVGASDLLQLMKVPLSVTSQLSNLEPAAPAGNAEASDPGLDKAKGLLQDKKYSEALLSLQSLPSATRNSFSGQMLLCRVQEGLQQYDAAITACDAASKFQPSDPAPLGLKGYLYLMAGDYRNAATSLEAADKLSNDDTYRALLSLAYYRTGQYSQITNLLSAESTNTLELSMLAGAQWHTSQYDGFKKTYEHLVALSPENGWKYFLNAYNEYTDLKFEDAGANFRKCDTDKDFVDSICAWGFINVETKFGQWDLANKDATEALTHYPDDKSLLNEAIFVNLLRGAKSSAASYYQQLKSTGQLDEGTSCLYFYAIDQPSLATEHCQSNTRENASSHTAWSNAGWAAVDNGNYIAASNLFAKAYNLFTADKAKHTATEEIDLMWGALISHYFGGDRKGAKDIYKGLKKMYPSFVKFENLKQLPLVWSQRSQQLVVEVGRDLK